MAYWRYITENATLHIRPSNVPKLRYKGWYWSWSPVSQKYDGWPQIATLYHCLFCCQDQTAPLWRSRAQANSRRSCLAVLTASLDAIQVWALQGILQSVRWLGPSFYAKLYGRETRRQAHHTTMEPNRLTDALETWKLTLLQANDTLLVALQSSEKYELTLPVWFQSMHPNTIMIYRFKVDACGLMRIPISYLLTIM